MDRENTQKDRLAQGVVGTSGQIAKPIPERWSGDAADYKALWAKVRELELERAAIKSPDLRKEKLRHEMNCAAWHSEHGQEINAEDCTCGLKFRIHVQTEQTLHAAWRKRAEEAEAGVSELEQALRMARSYVQEWADHWSAREQIGILRTVRNSLDEIDRVLHVTDKAAL